MKNSGQEWNLVELHGLINDAKSDTFQLKLTICFLLERYDWNNKYSRFFTPYTADLE